MRKKKNIKWTLWGITIWVKLGLGIIIKFISATLKKESRQLFLNFQFNF